jgi:alkylation response protein AidB-like acyl-CoA dehydrogenase
MTICYPKRSVNLEVGSRSRRVFGAFEPHQSAEACTSHGQGAILQDNVVCDIISLTEPTRDDYRMEPVDMAEAGLNAEDLALLSESAAQFARSKRTTADTSGRIDFSRADWSQMARQGWLSILIPLERDGLGLDLVAASAVARQLGRHARPEPFVAAGVAAGKCLAASTNSPLWNERLASFMGGELLTSLAWQPGGKAFDHGAGTVIARGAANGRRLTGSCRLVAAPASDAFIVTAHSEDGLILCWAEAGVSGLSLTIERCVDGSPLGLLQVDDVFVPEHDILAGGEAAAALLREVVDASLVVNAAELLGLMEGALALTLDYLRTRKQFGVTIGSFQSLQHRAVDIWIELQLTAAAQNAAARVAGNRTTAPLDRSAAASAVKARAAQAALVLAKEALQMHGAIGFAAEYGLGVFFNRAQVLAPWMGNAAQHRRRFDAISRGSATPQSNEFR